jgi:RNA polymerase subunit RPABC4/transcription elongation factor Spt4
MLYLFMLPWWVYRDARPRTEKALPLAIFVGITNFLGWLTYLVIRPEEQRQCPGCATLLEPGFRLCPLCGWGASTRCRDCGRPARAEWHFCPYCETPRQTGLEVAGR